MKAAADRNSDLASLVHAIRYGIDNKRRLIEKLLVAGTARIRGATETAALRVRSSDGTLHNYIDEDGWMQPRYRDEYPSSPYSFGQGNANPPESTVNLDGEDDGEGNTTLQLRLRTFNRTAANRVAYTAFEINHDVALDAANAGTHPIEMHIHYIPLDASTGEQSVKWTANYAVMNANTVNLSSGANLIQPQVATADSFTDDMQDLQRIAAFSNAVLPVPVGGWRIGQMIPVAVRLSADTTYAGNIGFLKVALHVPTDGNGSRQRFIK